MRNAVHGITALLLWAVFARYWYIVMQRPLNADTRGAIVSLGVLAFLSAVCLVTWVYYNIRLSKRLRRRKRRLIALDPPLRDFMGRWIVIDRPSRIADANFVEVDIRQVDAPGKSIEEKIFRTFVDGEDDDV